MASRLIFFFEDLARALHALSPSMAYRPEIKVDQPTFDAIVRDYEDHSGEMQVEGRRLGRVGMGGIVLTRRDG